jgi:hypothetical protein
MLHRRADGFGRPCGRIRIVVGKRFVWVSVLAFAAGTLFAAAGDDFYEGLYRRGVVHFNEGKFDISVRELRIAAFGLMDSIERFEAAQAYIVVASRRLGREADARNSLKKIVFAEKIAPTYAALELPATVREGVAAAAGALLTSDELKGLPVTRSTESH